LRDFLPSLCYHPGIQTEVACQGRRLDGCQITWLREWIAAHPAWSRKRLSRELCQQWDWRNGAGRLKDFAARSFLEKLAARGLVVLPPPQLLRRHPRPKTPAVASVSWPTEPVAAPLSQLQPLACFQPAVGTVEASRFAAYLGHYHYLGFRVVGENLKYLVQDRQGRDLACLLFGAAAWRAAARDEFLGWSESQKIRGLPLVTNNTRFLVLPWVKVRGLSSHILSRVARRLSGDWQGKYGHPIYLLETFVDTARFRGTCYRAANWECVGQTRGRGRQGRDHQRLTATVKDIYLYPLHRQFRQKLLEAA
jgi:hypothetical protein